MTKFKISIFVGLIFLCLLYFISRLVNLTSLPIFGDEAIYLRWSQLIKNVDSLRFVPLSDGKQPLYMWIVAVAMKFFSDPLWTGRLVSVISGWLTMLSIYLITAVIKNFVTKSDDPISFIFDSLKKNQSISLFASHLYILLPYTFFFDRLATADNLLSMFLSFSIFTSLLILKFPRFDLSIILGINFGFAWLTKSPAIFFLLIFLVFYLAKFRLNKVYLPLTVFIVSFSIYNILRLGPQFHQISLRNSDYIWSVTDILKHPLDPLIPHLKDYLELISSYLSIPLISISLLGLLISLKRPKFSLPIFFIAFLYLFSLIANLSMVKIFTGRYLFYTLPPLIILLSLSIEKVYLYFKKYINHFVLKLLIFFLFIPNLIWIYRFSVNPFTAVLPKSESGYQLNWTAGWGIKDISTYLIARSKVANVIVGTEGYFGTLPDGLQIYTDSIPKLTVFGVDTDLSDIPAKLIDARNYGDEVYLILNSPIKPLPQSVLDRLLVVKQYPKPDKTQIILYQLL